MELWQLVFALLIFAAQSLFWYLSTSTEKQNFYFRKTKSYLGLLFSSWKYLYKWKLSKKNQLFEIQHNILFELLWIAKARYIATFGLFCNQSIDNNPKVTIHQIHQRVIKVLGNYPEFKNVYKFGLKLMESQNEEGSLSTCLVEPQGSFLADAFDIDQTDHSPKNYIDLLCQNLLAIGRHYVLEIGMNIEGAYESNNHEIGGIIEDCSEVYNLINIGIELLGLDQHLFLETNLMDIVKSYLVKRPIWNIDYFHFDPIYHNNFESALLKLDEMEQYVIEVAKGVQNINILEPDYINNL